MKPVDAVGTLLVKTVALTALAIICTLRVLFWSTKLKICWNGFLSTLKQVLVTNVRQPYKKLLRIGKEPMSEPTWKTLDLQETGTRFEHYRELLDFWEDGLTVLSRINPKYLGQSEEAKITQLNTATSLLRTRIDQLSKFDTEKFKLGKVIDEIEMCRQYDKLEKDNLSKNSPEKNSGEQPY